MSTPLFDPGLEHQDAVREARREVARNRRSLKREMEEAKVQYQNTKGGSRMKPPKPPEPRPDVLPFSLLLWKDTLREWIARAGNQKTVEVSVRNLRDIANAIELAERGAR